MREMECVRENPNHDEYLKKLLKEAGLSPKFISWEDSKISANSPLMLILDEDHLDTLDELCEMRDLKLIVALNARREFKLVGQLKDHFDKIFGFIDLSQEIDYNTPILKNYVNMNFSSSALKLDQLAADLDKVYEYTKSELLRVKDLHDRLVKMRVDNLKGVSITSKFMAGEKSGGEFLDMMQTDSHVLIVQAGSDNYLLSSLIISELEVLKLSTPTTSLKEQGETFLKIINHHAIEMNAKLSYCLINVDLKNLQVDCNFKGDGFLYFHKNLISFQAPAKFKIKPTEKLYVLSNGAIKNLLELNPGLSIEDFYKENADKETRDLINEFFFEASRNKAGNFLIYDALMFAVEVDQKLYQI
ncbi:MAG: hypothetical protein K2Q18_02655 [Bdellovibrionales bacterium]|nr:hypothetical protein [Bdellovibrionales bacterium]